MDNSDPLTRAFDKIVALVNASEKSEQSLRERLQRAGFEDSIIEEALGKARDYRIVDDDRFAALLIRSRLNQGRGSIGIERDLKKNGIDPESLEGWPDAFGIDYDEEVRIAIEFLERKPPRSKNLREGAYRRAMQRGFPSSVASTAARLWYESLAKDQ